MFGTINGVSYWRISKCSCSAKLELSPTSQSGLENIGDNIEGGLDDIERYERKSAFLAVSKQFALPRIHHITGHIGIGNRRFVEDIGMSKILHGVFFGISKDFHPTFARGGLTVSVEVDGKGINTGLRHTADSGLQVYVAAEALNAPAIDGKEIRYLGWRCLDKLCIDETG